jgi:hypothetical protein
MWLAPSWMARYDWLCCGAWTVPLLMIEAMVETAGAHRAMGESLCVAPYLHLHLHLLR